MMDSRPAFLSRADALSRISRGDVIRMELRNGVRLWWFESPLAYVSDKIMSAVLFGHAPSARIMEAGDSLFGLPLNSQTWLPCAGGEH